MGQPEVRSNFCPANGSPGVVLGTDIYTDDSGVVHAGVISLEQGGTVTIEILLGQSAYSTRNGVTSANYAFWYRSFAFIY
jgi:LCCL domain